MRFRFEEGIFSFYLATIYPVDCDIQDIDKKVVVVTFCLRCKGGRNFFENLGGVGIFIRPIGVAHLDAPLNNSTMASTFLDSKVNSTFNLFFWKLAVEEYTNTSD